MNILEHYVELILPYIVSILEIMGIVVICWSAFRAFLHFIQNLLFHKNHNIQFHFAVGLATALEFKVAAEILNTVLIQELNEILILGAVILLRAILSILIHFEMKQMDKDHK